MRRVFYAAALIKLIMGNEGLKQVEIIFIRHGEPDYSQPDKRGFIGHGRDLAPLTKLGIRQAEEASKSPMISGSRLILSSPYTRALQTAAIISKNNGLDLIVETDLHELIPDKTFMVKGQEESDALFSDFVSCFGVYPDGEKKKWETIDEIINRTKAVFAGYYAAGHENIVAVTHGGVIRRYTGIRKIEHGEVNKVTFNPKFKCYAWC